MTKKTMSLVAVLLLVLSLGLLPAAAETEENTIYVSWKRPWSLLLWPTQMEMVH